MNLEEKIKELENVKYKIKRVQLRIQELRTTYFPSKKGEIVSHSNGNSSPQEVIVSKIDSLEKELQELQLQEITLNDEIYIILESIKDEKAKWIVTQRIRGKAWCEIDSEFSVSYMKHLYSKTLRSLKNGKSD